MSENPISSRTIRLARWAVAWAFLSNGFVLGCWAPHVPLVQARLGLSHGELSIALLAIAAGALVTMIGAGASIRRFGSTPVARAGAMVYFASLPMAALAPDLELLVAAAALFGAGNGLMDVAMNAHGVAVERRYGRPIMSSLHGMFSLGGLLGAGLGGPVLEVLSPASHSAGVAVVMIVSSWVIMGRMLPAASDSGGGETVFAKPPRAVLGLGALAFLCFLVEGAMIDWAAVFLTTVLGAGVALSGFGYAAFSAAMTVGRMSGDRLRARIGGSILLAGGGALGAVGLTLAIAGGTAWIAVGGFFLLGLGLANVVPILFLAGANQPGTTPAEGIAGVAVLGYLGILGGPPLIGAVAEATSLTVGLGLCVLCCAVVAAGAMGQKVVGSGG